MPDMLSIRESVQRARGDGMDISEYSLRHWVITGAVPTRKVGQKALIFYPNLVRFLRCEDGADNSPATVISGPGIRRVDL